MTATQSVSFRDMLALPLSIFNPPPVGSKALNMEGKPRPDIPRPNTLWDALKDLDHDFREEIDRDGKTQRVHSYQCRRCRLELLLRQATESLGMPPD